MFLKIYLLIALTITTKVLSQPISNESDSSKAIASLEGSSNDTKSKRQIQFIDFMPDHLTPFKLLTNYKPYDAFIYSNVEQSSGDSKTTIRKCTQCNRCSQRQNNADSSQAIRTVSTLNGKQQNNPNNSIVNRWLLMYIPNPFVAVPRTINTQPIQPVVNATRVNSVLLDGIVSTNKQIDYMDATGRRNKAGCSERRRCKCCGRISKKQNQDNFDNEEAIRSDEIDKSGELLARLHTLTSSNLEDKLLKTDIRAAGSTANKEKATIDQFKDSNSNRRQQIASLKMIASDLTETSTTNTSATKTDVNFLKPVARNTTKSCNGNTILTSINDSSLESKENDFKTQTNSTTNKTTPTDLEHYSSKLENNTVTNILIIQKTISKQNSKSIGSNHTSESSACSHQLQSNDALLHTSIKDSLSNSSITVLFSNHDNNKPLTSGQPSSKSSTKEVEINEKENLNLVRSHIPTLTADIRRQESNNTNLLSQAHNKDTNVERILSQTDEVKCSGVESSSPLSVYLHKIEESLSQPKNVIKENWKIVKTQPKRKNYYIEDCV